MSWNDVRKALFEAARARIDAVIGENRIAWPNVKFEIPTSVPPETFTYPVWCAVHYLPNTPTPITMGQEGEDETEGLLQIDVNQPRNTGQEDIEQVLTPLENYFTAGRILSKNSQETSIISCGRSPGRVVEDKHYRVSLEITWYSRLNRQPVNN